MKKLLFITSMVLISLALLMSSCDKDDNSSVNCVNLLEDISEAQATFINDMSEENCNTYKNALKEWLDNCDGIVAGQKEAFQASYDQLDCSSY